MVVPMVLTELLVSLKPITEKVELDKVRLPGLSANLRVPCTLAVVAAEPQAGRAAQLRALEELEADMEVITLAQAQPV